MSAQAISRARLNRGWRRVGLTAGLVGLLVIAKAALAWERGWYVTVNWTESLPHWAYVIDTHAEPQIGDFIDFWPPENDYYSGISFVKQVVAGPGDTVTCEGRTFFMGGQEIAQAKTHSQGGDALSLGPCGRVPEDHYFVVTPHKDSFDSRYGEIGHVPRDRVRGVARPLL